LNHLELAPQGRVEADSEPRKILISVRSGSASERALMSSAQAMAANLLVAARSEAHDSLIEQIRHVCPGFVVDEGEDFADALLRLLAAQI
jgi:hypothetical protein